MEKENWRILEESVEELFRSADYVTEQNVEKSGFQFDVIATKDEIAGFKTRYAIECKYRASKPVSNTDIHNFIVAFKALRDDLDLNYGIVVSRTGFSRQAHESVASYPSIKLLSYENLEDHLLGAQTYLAGTTKNYKSRILGKYIDPKSNLYDPSKGSTHAKFAEIERTLGFLEERIKSNPKFFGVVLGDFGSGKTTLAEQLHRIFSENYIRGGAEVYPIIFYLRTLAQYDTEHSFITAQFNQFSSRVSPSLFSRMVRSRKTLLILDGFDEVATNATEEERYTLFSRIIRLSQGVSHLIITSRPSYFTNISEVNSLIEMLTARDSRIPLSVRQKTRRDSQRGDDIFKRISSKAFKNLPTGNYKLFNKDESILLYIKPLSKKQIVEYMMPFSERIYKKHHLNVEEVYSILEGIYDLTDLMTRPLLLDMLIDILTEEDINLDDPNLEIGPAALYLTYVNSHLNRDWLVRQFLTREERLAFARAAALAMLEQGGSLEASYSSVERIIQRGMVGISVPGSSALNGSIENIVNDVRVCSFINITINDRIEFSHKSFMEYFIADVIVGKLRERGAEISELDRVLNYEILYFVGSNCLLRSDVRLDIASHISNVASGKNSIYQSNIKVAFLLSERASNERIYENIQFKTLKIVKREFNNCSFINVNFTNLLLSDVVFNGCVFNGVVLHGEIGNVKMFFVSGDINVSDLISNIEFSNISSLNIRSFSHPMRLHNAKILESFLTFLCHSINIDNVLINNSKISFDNVQEIEFSKCRIIESTLRGVEQRRTKPIRISFSENCVLKSVKMEGVTVTEDGYNKLRHVFSKCFGFILIDDDDEKFKLFMQKSDIDNVERYKGWRVQGQIVFVASHRRDMVASLDRGLRSRKEHEWNVDSIHNFLKRNEKIFT